MKNAMLVLLIVLPIFTIALGGCGSGNTPPPGAGMKGMDNPAALMPETPDPNAPPPTAAATTAKK